MIHSGAVRGVAFSSDGKLLATASADGDVHLLALPGFALQRTLRHGCEVNCVAISPRTCRFVLTAADDGQCRVWDLTSSSSEDEAADHAFAVSRASSSLVYSCCISGDDTRCLACTWAGEVEILAFPHGAPLMSLRAHDSVVMSVACDLAFSRALSACWDGTCRVWDLSKQQPHAEERELSGHEQQDCNAVAICQHTGRLGASASNDRTVVVWDLDRGVELRRLRGHSDIVVGVALHTRAESRGQWAVLSAAWDGTVRLHKSSSEDGVVVAEHRPKAACVAFSRSGGWFASGGFDARVAAEDLAQADRVRLATLAQHPLLPTDICRVVRHMLF